MKNLSAIVILLWIYGILAWVINLIKFFNCDFDAPYKEEIIHAIGVFGGPLAMITVWF